MNPLKNLSLAAVSLLVCLTGVASVEAIPSWAESYGVGNYIGDKISEDPFYGSGFDFPVAMAKMPDGGFVVAGQLDLPKLYPIGYHTSDRAMGSLVRFAADGTILWQKILRQTNDSNAPGSVVPAISHVYRIAADATGNIFIVGGKGNPSNSGVIPFVAKFSPAGDLIWQNGIGGASATVGDPAQTVPLGVGAATYMGLTNDGGVVITLSQSRPNIGYSIPVLAKFNSNGALVLYKAYDNSIQYLGSTPVCQSQDGSRYVMAFVYAQDGSALGSRYGLLLLVTDSDGNIVAQRGYNHSDSPGEQPVAIVATADGGYATLSVAPDYAGGILRKFNPDLSAEIFHARIAGAPGYNQHVATNSLVETADGGFLIGGETVNDFSASQYDVMLMKISSAGAFQFVSILGGPKNDGGPLSNGPTTAFALETADGGYGLAATTGSYSVGGMFGGGFYVKPDWWMAKTDANRKVRNFTGAMLDQSLDAYALSGSPETGADVTAFSAPTYPYGAVTTTLPQFIVEDLSLASGVDLPTLAIQASSPRIVSPHEAEAVVGQHFAYHALTAFFPVPADVTFNAVNLPSGFVINANTGVISGVPAQGSETATPIAVTLNATDGTDTATITLNLTIGDGVPQFAVNGTDQPAYPDPSATPVAGLTDKVLSFTAKEPGALAGRIMNVEATTTPDNGASWQRLGNGSNGYMTYDAAEAKYVLNSTAYPQQSNVYFRAKLTAQGKPDAISNVVGPFDLASGVNRAGQVLLSIVRNGVRADFDFRARLLAPPAGVGLRVQSSTNPSSEGNWSDLADGTTGQMSSDGNDQYSHTANHLPAANGVYFRVVASLNSAVDSLSNIIGPFNLIDEQPPQVTLNQPIGSSGGTGQKEDPLIFKEDGAGKVDLKIMGSASFPQGSPRSIKSLSALVDGSPIETVAGVNNISIDYTTTRIGLRRLDLLATDDLGATARAGTGTLWIRIDPPVTGASVTRAPKSTNASLVSAPAFSGRVFILTVDGGSWQDPNSWTDTNGNHGVPGASDMVIISAKTVVSSIDVEVASMIMVIGHFNGTYLTIGQSLTIVEGGMGPATAGSFFYLVTRAGALAQMVNFAPLVIDGEIDNSGTWRMAGFGGLFVNSFHNHGVSDFQMPLLDPPTVAAGLPATPRSLTTGSFLNSGLITVSGINGIVAQGGGNIVAQGGGNIVAQGGGNLVNLSGGTIVAQGGGNIVAQGGGNIVAQGGGNIVAQGGGNIVAQGGGNAVQQGSLLFSPDGVGIVAQGGGNIVAQGGGNIVAQGGGNIAPLQSGNRSTSAISGGPIAQGTVSSGFVQTAGETDMNYVIITGETDLQGGVLSGSGVIDGDLTVNGGFISPGHSAGSIAVTSSYSQAAGGTMVIEAAGAEDGQFDQVQVGGPSSLNGKLVLRTTNGYVPLANDGFVPFGYNNVSGFFSAVSDNASTEVNSTGLNIVFNPAAPNPPPPALLNISTRVNVQAGEDVAIGGFIIDGSGSKRVIVRALGPSLSGQAVSDPLANPTLELHDGNGAVTFNDDWKETQQSEIEGTGLAPTNDLESAMVMTLAAGGYTAVVRGANGETGVGLVEVYDLDSGTPTTPGNISTRGHVGTGDDVMIGGFILGGDEPTKVVIRAVGPSLIDAGVADALLDPVLELHNASGAIISNDDWRESQENEIMATGLAPTDARESAILAVLSPGGYTAIVRGKNGASGVALVEAYKVLP